MLELGLVLELVLEAAAAAAVAALRLVVLAAATVGGRPTEPLLAGRGLGLRLSLRGLQRSALLH